MSFIEAYIKTRKNSLILQLTAGLLLLLLLGIVFIISKIASLSIEEKINCIAQVITAIAAILGLLIISINAYYTSILAQFIQQSRSNINENFSSAKQLLLEKLLENQDIEIEVSYGEPGRDNLPPERLYQAIEQLGSIQVETRLGAIYTLEQIAKDCPNDHWAIMELFAAFIRENAPIIVDEDNLQAELIPLPTDIQAALTALARRDIKNEQKNQKLDLRYIDIRGADLSNANLHGADFTGSDLRHVTFYMANLENADFSGVNLQEAVFYEANLQCCLFYEADLQATILRKANLSSAVFYLANLQAAILYDANLSEVIFYQANLATANLCDANLEFANLEACNLSSANLIGSNLQGANLIGANLQNASLSTANLQEAILYEAILVKTNLCDTNMTKANLVGANLTGTILQDANLNGADLSRVENLEQNQLELALGDRATILPGSIKFPNHWMQEVTE
jgi:uncharacterized protein YjbI with pentapeptide repeats